MKASDLFVVTANKLLGDRCAEPLMLLYFLLNCPSIRKHSPPAQKEHYGPLHPIVGGDERARVPIIFTAHTLCYKMNDPGVKHPLSISAHLSDSNSVFPRPKIGCSWGMYYGTLSSLLFPESCNLISSHLKATARLSCSLKGPSSVMFVVRVRNFRDQNFAADCEYISTVTESVDIEF